MFGERIADGLRDAAFNLSEGQYGMDDAPHFLQSHKVIHARLVSYRIYRYFGDIDGPGKRAVGVALILFVVPVNVGRLLILAIGV